ncbi:hypothetical protein ACFOOP_12545 [Marinicaulis aureus]|uniref:Uncharacterized protein n=1 Tax=Hyphococcus aureus TaxID=2666033 RepID=A0ABW1L0Y9_9PROT
MNNPILRKLAWLGAIVLMAALAVFVFSMWGLAGSAVLLGFWLVFYAGSSFVLRRNQQRARDIFANMTEEQRQATLAALSESDRAEILEALKAGRK